MYVETPLDTDLDGRRDRVRIRVSRPRQTESQGIDYTTRPRPGTRLTLAPPHSRIRLPVVGGARGLGLYDHRAPGG